MKPIYGNLKPKAVFDARRRGERVRGRSRWIYTAALSATVGCGRGPSVVPHPSPNNLPPNQANTGAGPKNLSPTHLQILIGRKANEILVRQKLGSHPELDISQMVGLEFWTDDPVAAVSWAAGSHDVALIGLYRSNYQPAGYRCFAMLRRDKARSAQTQTVVIGTKRHDLVRDEKESKLMGFTLLADSMPTADKFASNEHFAGTLMMATRWRATFSLLTAKDILSPPPKLFVGVNWIMGKGSRKLDCCLTAEVPTPTLKHASTW